MERIVSAEPDVGLDVDQPPFDLLGATERDELRRATDIAWFPAGEQLIAAGSPSPHVFVVLKGRVEAHDDASGRREQFAEYGPGDLFGAFAAIAGRARHTYVAAEDTLCFAIPAPLFLDLTHRNPRFGAYFHESLAVKRRLLAERDQPSDLAELMMTRIRDALVVDAVEVPPSGTIADAVAAMRAGHTDCVLVRDGDRLGIATRTDLLDALALKGVAPGDPVGRHASFPALALEDRELLFQALVTMTERHIHRVVVTREGRVAGTLGLMEVLSHFSSKSHVISFRLARATTVGELADAAGELTRLVRTLSAQGAKMSFLMEIVGALNARLLGRLYDLTVPAEVRGRACLAVLGSEGRREQILKTDQDNLLVLADDLDWPEAEAVAREFSARLEAMGWPPCPGGVMVRNPEWRRTQSEWIRQVRAWTRAPDPAAMMNLAILFDGRPVAGDEALFEPIREAMFGIADDEFALRAFAQPAVDFHTPLTLFGGIREGERGVDLKKGGIFPIVHGLRVLALKHRIARRNSFDRAEALITAGVLEARFGRDLMQSLAVFIRLRLAEQIRQMRDGQVPGNRIVAADLRRLDRDLLRDALRVAGEFKGWLKGRFNLE
jgi:CBS domain-containing protein